MGRWMRGALALWMLCCAASPAGAIGVSDGAVVGQKVADSIAGYDAAAGRWRLIRVGANGEMFVTELNPLNYQFAAVTIVSSALTAGQANTSTPATGLGLTPYDASLYGYKWARITTSSVSNAATPWSVRWWGSVDGITYIPLTKGQLALTGGAPTGTLYHRFGPAIAVDTLKQVGNGNAATGWFPLVTAQGFSIMLKKIVAVASMDSAVGIGTITIEVAGRQQ